MEPQEEKDKIERLKKGLYSRKSPDIVNKKFQDLSQSQYEVSEDWKSEETPDSLIQSSMKKRKSSFLIKLLFVSAIFFVIAIGFAFYMFYIGGNSVSANNIGISILGPVSIAGGDTLSMDIGITNGNSVTLENVVLSIEYPSGTRALGNNKDEFIREKEDVGLISAGETIKRTKKAVLFGEKDSTKEIIVSLEYRVSGSNAIFSKQKKYEVAINSSPIVLDVSYPTTIGASQPFSITLNLSSNSSVPVDNLLVSVDYPFGFVFKSSIPDVSFGNNVWKIGTLDPGSKRVIKITGSLEAQNNEERTFRSHAGIAGDDGKSIVTDFVSSLNSLSISKPLLGLDVTINNSPNSQIAIRSGDLIKTNIGWSNNLSTKVIKAKVEAKFSGVSINKSSVNPGLGGFYRSIDNTVVWDSSSVGQFLQLNPGDSGTLPLEFSLISLPPGRASSRNQGLDVDFLISGTRFSEDGSSEDISYNVSKKIKVSTDASLISRSSYSTGAFKNTGPVPPKAEKETSYTITWAISNSFNDISNGLVSAPLPSYVKWLGQVYPETEDVQFDQSNNRVVWNVGNISAGAGFSTDLKQVSFKVSLLPSISQVGSAPAIIKQADFSGLDSYTNIQIFSSAPQTTTQLVGDPAFGDGDDKVIK